MNVLEQIIAKKRVEIEKSKTLFPVEILRHSPLFNAVRPSFRASLDQPGPSVIAEFKRKSPSKGLINLTARPEDIVKAYEAAGAAAVSVLTDPHFSGTLQDLVTAFSYAGIPLLRKDFIIDPYQIFEARSAGASAILLIAAALEQDKLKELSALALSLDMDVLFEVHNEAELEKCPDNVSIIGVNNRNLETFVVNTEISMHLAGKIPGHCLKVSESGISDPGKIRTLSDAGYDAFLIGEAFMSSGDPGEEAARFINAINESKPSVQ